MAQGGFLMHVSLAALFTGAAAVGVRFIPGLLRADEPPRNVSRALTAFALLMTLGGWLALLLVRDGGGLGFMVGLSAAGVAVKGGVRHEIRRLGSLGGTPFASMMKRVTLLYLVLALGSGPLLLLRAAGGPVEAIRAPISLGMSAMCLIAAIAWRAAREKGPLAPGPSVAWRATLFGLAIWGMVTLLAAYVLAGGTPEAVRRFARCAWMGVGVTCLLLAVTAWAATRLAPRTAVLLVGAAWGTAGLCLYGSL